MAWEAVSASSGWTVWESAVSRLSRWRHEIFEDLNDRNFLSVVFRP